MAISNKINSSGNYFIGGEIDEFSASITHLSSKTITYDFTNNNATVSFLGATISGLASIAQAAGLYTVSNVPSYTTSSGGANGGIGGYLGNSNAGGGGSLGGANGKSGGASYSGSTAPNDVSGLLAAAAAAGAAADFAYGAAGSETGFGNGRFAGGGGTGKGFFSYQPALPGGNAGILIKYNNTYSLINQSSGAGSITLPAKTTYLKIWCIGKGGDGGGNGNGGGGGGVAYIEFDFTSITSTSNANTVSKQYSNGYMRIIGEYDEVTYSADYLISYLLVAGGGAGGGGSGGGGGAGGYIEDTLQIFPGTNYSVVIGAGGPRVATVGANGSNGGDSTLTGAPTAVGGGFGGTEGGYGTATTRGANGGSGGGSVIGAGSSSGTADQGYGGGNSTQSTIGSGGGGAGAVGENGYFANPLMYAGNGGIGKQSSITGTPTYYAGGGAGGFNYNWTIGGGGQGGLGGGGNGGFNGNGGAGASNTGGGGGGGGHTQSGNAYGGSGGSGICILKVLTSRYTGQVTGSPTVTTSGIYTIIKFTSSGSYTA